MGARLSQPRSPGGTTEASRSIAPGPPPTPRDPFPRRLNRRTIAGPAAVLILGGLLYVYSRTSIRAAKANAQRHREADSGTGGAGGGIDLLRETRRRHGREDKVESRGTVGELVGEVKRELAGNKEGKGGEVRAGLVEKERSEEEEMLRAAQRRGRGG